VDRDALRPGRSIFLNSTQNLLTGIATSLPRPGIVGEFSRLHGASQAVIRGPADEELVVDLATDVVAGGIDGGDLLLYDRETLVACEKIPRKRGTSGMLEELPLDVKIEDLGGLDVIFDDLTSEVTLHLFHPELVQRFHLKPTKGVLLCGPPGTGKTSLVQALGEHISRAMGVEVKVLLVPPGVHRSKWYGDSEQRVHDLFREATETAEPADRYVLLFFDDIDHLGSRDHRAAGEVDARLLPCFFKAIDSVRCPRLMLIGATNRADLLDEALVRPGRFGSVFRTGRPDRRQAREIFRRHLPSDLPIAGNGHAGDLMQDVIEDLLASIYAPNGELSRLATLTFRDGSRHPLLAAQVMSGAVIAAVAERAKRPGCLRGLKGGPAQIEPADLHAAVASELSAIAERLRPGPALSQMIDLPPDMDVVRIELCRSNDPQRIGYLRPSPT
jgi:proteasome-associated ATPase